MQASGSSVSRLATCAVQNLWPSCTRAAPGRVKCGAPKSGHSAAQNTCPLRAKGGHRQSYPVVGAGYAAGLRWIRFATVIRTANCPAHQALRVYGRVDSAPTLERVRLLCATLVFGSEGSATEPFGSWWRGT